MKKMLIIGGIIACFATTAFASSWSTSISKDEMTGKSSAYANSVSVQPTKIMDFPYNDVKAWLGVGCDGKDEWAYIGFTTAPNLNGSDIRDGYNHIDTRIKVGNKVESVSLTQGWGSKALHFDYDKKIINEMKKANSILLELNWHGNNPVYFKFPLDGSSKALHEIEKECKK